jgi:hypothetical protein
MLSLQQKISALLAESLLAFDNVWYWNVLEAWEGDSGNRLKCPSDFLTIQPIGATVPLKRAQWRALRMLRESDPA